MKVEATETHQGQISGGDCLITIQTGSVAVQYICVSVPFIHLTPTKMNCQGETLKLQYF